MRDKHAIVTALLVLLVLYLIWLAYCRGSGRRVIGLVGYSTDSSKAVPTAGVHNEGSSNVMGVNIQAR